MAIRSEAVARGQQLKPAVEPSGDVRRRHAAHAGSRQLDRQRDAVKVLADLNDRNFARCVEGEIGTRHASSVEEELHALGGPTLGHRERRDGPDMLAADSEWLLAGGNDPDRRRRVGQPVDNPSDLSEKMLAVVNDDERVVRSCPRAQRVQRRFASAVGGVHRLENR